MSIPISQLQNGGVPNGQVEIPGTNPLDTTQSPNGSTFKYILVNILQYILNAQGFITYTNCRVATTSLLNASYANGVAGVGATLTNSGAQVALSIDGQSLAIDDRVLVKDQTNTFENGIYVVTNAGSNSTNWILTRADDYNQPLEIIYLGVVAITQGTTNAGLVFQEIAQGPFVIGTSPILYQQLNIDTTLLPSASPANKILRSDGTYWVQSTNASLTATDELTGLTELQVDNININGNTITSTDVGGNIVITPDTTGSIVLDGLYWPQVDGTNGQVLTTNGAGILSWTTQSVTNPAALTRVNDVNVTLTLGGTPATSLLQAVSLTLGWSGLLGIARGGTGVSTVPTNGQLLIGNGAGYQVANITPGAGISITNGAGSITINNTAPGTTPAALTEVDDTNVTMTLGGSPSTALLQAVSMTLGWTGLLAISRGGTGVNTVPTNGQLLIGNGTGYTVSGITAGSGISVTNGSGSITIANTAPSFTPSALTRINDTNVTMTLGGTPSTALLQAVSMTLGWTGLLAISRGGTGVSTVPTNGQILIGNGTGYTVANISAGTGISVTNGAGSIQITNTSSSSGTVNAGLQNQLGYYASNGTTISGLTTANNGVLVTNGSGVPSISSTLPTAVQGNITSTGTISSGTWQGGIIQPPYGGTGINNGSSTLTLGGSLSTIGAFTSSFTMTGNTAVTFPTSGTLATTSQIPSVTPAAMTRIDDTNVTLTLGGTPATSLLQAVSLTLGWTGTLGISRGGTGLGSTPTNGQLLIGNGTGYTLADITAGTGISVTNGSGSITISNSAPSPTPSALTSVSDTNVTITLGGTPSTALLQAVSITMGWTGTLGVTRGGTGNSIVGAAGTIAQSDGTKYTFTTATYPSTTTINNILYSSANNVVNELATANSAVLLTSSTGVPGYSSTLTNGQLIIGNTGNTPTAATLTAGTGITITNGAGSITIASSGGTGTVNSGTANQIAYYATTGTTVSGLTGAIGSLLVTDATGVPSMLANPSDNDRILMSKNGDTPFWSTAAYPKNAGAAGKILISDGTDFVETQATYLSTTNKDHILYSSANNTIAEISTQKNAVLVSDNSNTPQWSGSLTDGQIIIGKTNALPAAANLTAGTGISITNGANTITIANTAPSPTAAAMTSVSDTNVTLTLGGSPSTSLLAATSLTMGWSGTLGISRGGTGLGTTPTNGQVLIGNGTNYTLTTLTAGSGVSISNGAGSITISATTSAFGWTEVTGTTQAMVADNGYVSSNAAQVVMTLPATAAFGTVIYIVGKGAGGWKIAQNSGQNIQLGSTSTTVGVTGYLESTNRYDSIQLLCTTADTTWTVLGGPQGNITVA